MSVMFKERDTSPALTSHKDDVSSFSDARCIDEQRVGPCVVKTYARVYSSSSTTLVDEFGEVCGLVAANATFDIQCKTAEFTPPSVSLDEQDTRNWAHELTFSTSSMWKWLGRFAEDHDYEFSPRDMIAFERENEEHHRYDDIRYRSMFFDIDWSVPGVFTLPGQYVQIQEGEVSPPHPFGAPKPRDLAFPLIDAIRAEFEKPIRPGNAKKVAAALLRLLHEGGHVTVDFAKDIKSVAIKYNLIPQPSNLPTKQVEFDDGIERRGRDTVKPRLCVVHNKSVHVFNGTDIPGVLSVLKHFRGVQKAQTGTHYVCAVPETADVYIMDSDGGIMQNKFGRDDDRMSPKWAAGWHEVKIPREVVRALMPSEAKRLDQNQCGV